MNKRKTWKDFQKTGLFLVVNQTLHLFGWSIIIETDEEGILDVYPARVDYMGFENEAVQKAYKKVRNYMRANIESLVTNDVELPPNLNGTIKEEPKIYFDNKETIIEWLDDKVKGHYRINEDLSVDVKGDFVCYKADPIRERLPVKFNVVTGDFSWCGCFAISLEGTPRKVGGDFNVNGNDLTSLEGGPEVVKGKYECGDNKLFSLRGACKKPSDYSNNPCSWWYDNNPTWYENIHKDLEGLDR